ncbi:Tbingi protein [Diplonema papillatum]|nr:Tbingi protein [Diplonema papillatum]
MPLCPPANTRSYCAEEFALYSCLKFLLRLLPPTPTPLHILILSDSQSLLMTLRHGPHCQTQPYPIAIWQLPAELESRGCTVTLQFVFGHCGLEGNERADKTAKRGALAFMRAGSCLLHPRHASAPRPPSAASDPSSGWKAVKRSTRRLG